MVLPTVTLPRFAQRVFTERCRCPRCGKKIDEEDVRSVGARRSNDGAVCFSYQYECPACRKVYAVTDRLRSFTRTDWWTELAQWHDDAATAADLPRIGRMVLDMIELESICIRGGYRGQVGPVMLIYSNSKGSALEGFLRLEPNSTVSLYDHEAPHGLPRSDLAAFTAAEKGSTFELDGLTWTKMSPEEIEKIIRDRVFEVTTQDDPAQPTVSNRRKKARRRHPQVERRVTWQASRASEPSYPSDESNDESERPEFFARKVCVLSCTPGNFHHAEGEPASIITLGHMLKGEVNPWVISLRDSKMLVTKLLVVLATNDDEFAQRLLDQHFSADKAGNFEWPDEPHQPF